jgi:hypothetical protein
VVGVDDEDDEIAAEQEDDRNEGWLLLSALLLAEASRRLFTLEPTAPQGEALAGISVPPGIVRIGLQRAGGAIGTIVNGTSITVEGGRPAGLVATGERVRALAAASLRVVWAGWEWQHGDPARPFPPHEALDGVQFTSFDDERLAITAEGDWLGTDHYFPADHAGCTCLLQPVTLEPSESTQEMAASATLDAGGT